MLGKQTNNFRINNGRCKLYNLDPMALGTPYIESLASYISRLAEVHTVTTGTLVSEELAPLLNKSYLSKECICGGSRFYEASGALNGYGTISKDCIKAIEVLTGRDDLSSLTLTYWKDILPSRELLRSSRAWCPLCFKEWKTSGLVIYEPLLWNIKTVNICPKHKVRLQDKCPNSECKNENFVLARKSRLGFCSKCGCWLGEMTDLDATYAITQEELEWQNWIIDGIEKMLLYHQTNSTEISRYSLVEFVRTLSKTAGGLKALARKLHLPITTIKVWYDGKNRPKLESLLYLSFKTNISVVDLLTNQYKDSDININDNVVSHYYKRSVGSKRKFNIEDAKRMLEESLRGQEYPPPSMREIARRLGYDKRLIYKYFSELCNSISERYLDALNEQRQKRIENLCYQVRQATFDLSEKGLYPSRRRIEAYIGQGILREQAVKMAWHEAIKLLGLEFNFQ